jgi:hypothetical protein
MGWRLKLTIFAGFITLTAAIVFFIIVEVMHGTYFHGTASVVTFPPQPHQALAPCASFRMRHYSFRFDRILPEIISEIQ